MFRPRLRSVAITTIACATLLAFGRSPDANGTDVARAAPSDSAQTAATTKPSIVNATASSCTSTYAVTTLAGSAGLTGSLDGTGSAARFNQPAHLALDSAGNVIVADWANDTIRKVTPAGAVTTIAGAAGVRGANDGAALSARFVLPSGVALDAAGNIYIGDTGNDTIRKLSTAGTVTTVAGSAGSYAETDGTGSAARFANPYQVAVDSAGNLFVVDNGDTVRKVTPSAVVSTLAGLASTAGSADGAGSAARFATPEGVTIDSAGNLFIADTGNSEIRKVTPAGVVTTIAGTAGSTGSVDGTGSAARFNLPYAITMDGANNLYVADTYNSTIRMITPGGVVTTIAGSAGSAASIDGTGSAARFNFPDGIVANSAGSILYVAEWKGHVIRKIAVTTVCPVPDLPTAINVPATTTSGIFNVSWTPATTGAAATSFTLQQATSLSGPWSTLSNAIPADTTSYSVTVNTSGTYYYQIAACNSNGCSAFKQSTGVVATLSVPSCTSIAFGLNPVPYGTNTQTVTISGVQNATTVYVPTWWIPGGQNDIQWPLAANQGGGVWKATIDLTQFDPGNPRYGAFESDVWMGNSTYHNGQLVGCGGGSWTRTPPAPPAAPTSVSAMMSGGSNVIVTWVPNTSGGPIDSFRLNRATSSSGPWSPVNWTVTPGTRSSYTDSGLPPGTYYYEVAACGTIAGCSGYTVSPAVTVTGTPQSDTPAVTNAPSRDAISDAVGATLAQFRVDEGGNATYSIPIQVPPGTAGLTPKVALSYNNRMPSNVMGPGWAIEGASQIARCRQTRENGDFMSGTTPQDGNPAPVNFTTSDRFCLDGVRLLLLSGTYGGDQSTYSPENDPTTRVTAALASASNAAPGPVTFSVQRKDGSTATYGSTIVSRNAGTTATVGGASVNVAWSIARVSDSVGNYMDYLYNSQPASGTYTFAAGAVESTLAQINYTGHTGTPNLGTYASVAFTYGTLPANQLRVGYQAGVTFLQSQQLQSVSVSDSTRSPSALRYYQLSYQSSASGTALQQLSQVQECRDSSMAVCYPPTTFAWSTANYTLASEGTQTGPNFTNLDSYKVADVDGDGRLDFVFAVHNDSHCSASVSAIYVGFMDRNISTNQLTLSLASQTPVCAAINLAGNDQSWYLLDYDGDGMADLLLGGGANSTWAIYASQGRPAASGRVFGTTNLIAALAIQGPATGNAAGILADVNGDGLPDFIYAVPPSGTSGPATMMARLMVRQGDGTFGFSGPYGVFINITSSDTQCGSQNCTYNFFTNDTLHRSALVADVNGDGRSDFTMIVQEPTDTGGGNRPAPGTDSQPVLDSTLGSDAPAVPQAIAKTYWFQFTANGVANENGYPYPVLHLQESWHQLMHSSGGSLPDKSSNMYVVDLNGDGLSDLMYQDPSNATTYQVMINAGNGYQPPVPINGVLTNNADGSPALQLADVDGDGRVDVLYPSLTTGTSNYSYVSLYPNTSTGAWQPGSVQTLAGVQASAGWIGMLADFDADGAPDYLRINRSGSGNLYTGRAASSSRYHARDVITGFSNGLGATTNVVYQPLTNHGVYQWGVGEGGVRAHALNSTNWGYGSPVFDVLAPMYVVSQASSSAPTQGAPSATSTVYYRYQGALMQSGGRGFLGFWSIWTFDANDAANVGNQYMMTRNGYTQQYPFAGFPEVTYKEAFSGTVTRGSATLDACALNGAEANTACFAPGVPNGAASDPAAWPNITENGVYISASQTLPYCNGAGCAAMPTTLTDACTGRATALRSPQLSVSQITDGIFSPPATPGPIFVYATQTSDSQLDLNNSPGLAGVAYTAQVQSNFCYDTALPSHGNLVNSAVVTSDADSNVVQQKYTSNTYGAENTTSWFLGRLTNSTVTFKRPGATDVTRTTDFTYDPGTGLLTSERIQKGGPADQDLRTRYVLDAFGNRTAAYQCSYELSDAACASTSGFVERQSGTQVHRYAKTTFDSRGRYSTSSQLPFTSSALGLNEQTAITTGNRDEFGNPTLQISANGTRQTSFYGAFGRPYFASDNTGKASTTTYRLCGSGAGCSSDPMFKFRAETVTTGNPTAWTYFDVLGRPVLKITQNFNIENGTAGQLYSGTCSFYDSHNRAAYQSEPFFVNVTTAADNSPNLTATTASPCAGLPYATTSRYDVLGRVVKVTNPDGGIVNKSYVGLTSFTSSPRNAGWQWEETRNALGEVVETRDPDDPLDPNDNLVVDTYYDAAGDVTQVTRNAGNGLITTSMGYDTLGRKTSHSDPDAGMSSYTYNAAGDVITQTDAKSQRVTNSYDAMGRRYQRATSSAADGNNFTDTWTYDTAANGLGQLASEARPAFGTQQPFSRTYTYDGYGRIYQRSTTINVTSTYTETTAYDLYGRTKTQQDASGYLLTPHYTPHGFVDYQNESRTGTRTYQMNSANERGEVTSETRGGIAALTSVHSYFAATGKLYQLCSGNNASLSSGNCTGGNLQNLAFNFDLAGNLSARSHLASGQTYVEFFKYDALSRLTQVGVPQISTVLSNPTVTAALTLTYDKLGNICSKTLNGQAAQNYSYVGPAGCANHGTSGSPHAVGLFNGVAYYYDQDGNQTHSTGGNRILSFDALNQMTKASNASDNATFQYAETGERFQRVDQNGKRTTYIGNIEIVVSGGVTEIRRYLAGVAIDYVRSSGVNETRYVLGDHLGSTDVIAKSDGTLYEQTSFDAHGNRRDPNTWSGTGTALSSTTHGFTGHEQLDTLGIIHMNGRIYDPQLGRMLQADPLNGPGPQGLNRYSYVANNPLTLTDPSGLSWFRSLMHFLDKVAGVLTLGPLYSQWHNQWNSFVSNPYVRMVGAIVASYFTFGAAYAALGEGFWAGVGAGAASGFVAGAITSQSLTGALQGAFSGAIAGGIYGYYGKLQSFERVSVETVAGGVEAKIEGGDFVKGMAFAGAISLVNLANSKMRQVEVERASQHEYNVNGDSSGFYGDGIKMGGSRRAMDPLLNLEVCDSTAGGCQGAPVNPGDVRGRLGPINYEPHGVLDTVVESFAGPHDWIRDMTGSYDAFGNSNQFEGFAATLDKVRNYIEIPMAAPFAAAGLIHETPGVYLALQRCQFVEGCR